MTRTHKVSADVLLCARLHADELFARDPMLQKRWLAQACTSLESRAAGGIARLETDYDWIVAFLTWHSGGQIARER